MATTNGLHAKVRIPRPVCSPPCPRSKSVTFSILGLLVGKAWRGGKGTWAQTDRRLNCPSMGRGGSLYLVARASITGELRDGLRVGMGRFEGVCGQRSCPCERVGRSIRMPI